MSSASKYEPGWRFAEYDATAASKDTDASIVDRTCPICLDDMQSPQMLTCGHLFCKECVITHATVQKAAGRPVNCPCCVRPITHEEQQAWSPQPPAPAVEQQPVGGQWVLDTQVCTA